MCTYVCCHVDISLSITYHFICIYLVILDVIQLNHQGVLVTLDLLHQDMVMVITIQCNDDIFIGYYTGYANYVYPIYPGAAHGPRDHPSPAEYPQMYSPYCYKRLLGTVKHSKPLPDLSLHGVSSHHQAPRSKKHCNVIG